MRTILPAISVNMKIQGAEEHVNEVYVLLTKHAEEADADA